MKKQHLDLYDLSGYSIMQRYNQYKGSAKQREHEFLLSKEEFKMFWNEKCTYCGDVMFGIGLDRLDSIKGYYVGNVVQCCTVCNRMKLNHDIQFFLNHCRKIVENSYNK